MLTVVILALIALTALIGAFLLARHRVRLIEARHPPSAEFINVAGIRLHYRRTGNSAQPAILVLHGATSNLEEPFAALSERLEGEHVIWLDRPGLGWSDRPEGPWSPEREAALIADFLDEIGVSSALVVGHSWGGAIAMRLAMDHPARVDALLLIAPALSAWIGEAAWFNKVSFWPGAGWLLTHVIVPIVGEKQTAAGARSAFHPEPVPADYVSRTSLPLLLRPRTWRANAADMKCVNEHLEVQETRYQDIEHHTLVLAGKGDTVLWSHRHGGQVAARMPNGEMRWIGGAGHNLHHHHPEAVHDAILALRERAAGSSGLAVQNAE